MNKERRNSLKELVNYIEEIKKQAGNLATLIEDAVCKLQDIKDEEQQAYDNLPESLQNGEKGLAMADAISEMESAEGELECLKAELDADSCDNAISNLENAQS